MTLPQHLYKYEALTSQTLTNLKSQVVYFGSPLGFNDPYDCALTPNISAPSDAEVEEIRQAYLNNDETPQAERNKFQVLPTQELREIFVRSARNILETQTSEFFEKWGVACFAERNDNLLMWSHYGGCYRGICLEFSTKAETLAKVRQVRYVDSPPKINVLPLLVDHDFDAVLELFCTKSSSWAYEREWRAIHAETGTEFTYRAADLTGVYFGPDIDQQSLEIVCLVLRGQNGDVRFWRGERSSTEFRVLFEEFTYLSHLEAKQHGLLPGDESSQ